jgi:high-affinity Fe2+/Pb2+ permease
MKAYLIITGTIFGLITAAHIWRIVVESSLLAREPWFMTLTILAAAMFTWAVLLLRRAPKSITADRPTRPAQ